ncbi:MAG: tetratricopeptide repeat protein [Rhodospirillaceae bacterium]
MVKASAEELVRRLASSENTSALNIKRSPESAEELKETGIKYFYAGNLNAAGSYYRRAIQSKPDFAEAHNNLGTVLRKRNRPQSAIAAFQTALLLNPQSGFAYGNLGNLWLGPDRSPSPTVGRSPSGSQTRLSDCTARRKHSSSNGCCILESG